jgi:hypothetical protein
MKNSTVSTTLARAGALLSLSVGLTLGACGGDDPPSTSTCEPNTFCPCEAESDCPAGETCSPAVGICVPGGGGETDAGTDASTDASTDAGEDVTEDSGADTSEDTTEDAGSDVGEDTGEDVGEDATEDAGTDGGEDAGADVGEDAGADAGEDSGPDPEVCDDLIDNDGDSLVDCDDPECESDVACIPEYIPWIAFASVEMGVDVIYFIRADGEALTRFDNGDLLARSPVFSPDGSRMAYIGYNPDVGETSLNLRVVDFSDGSVETLDTGFVSVANPSWSPDGTELVVEAREDGDPANGIFIVDADTGATTAVTENVNGDSGPKWCEPDVITFVRNLGGLFDVYTTDPEGSTPASLTSGSSIVGGVSYTPGCDAIVYARSSGSVFLVRMDIDTLAESTICEEEDGLPSFFATGDQMALTRRGFDTGTELIIADTETCTLVRRLTRDEVLNQAPSVSPVHYTEIDLGVLE